MKRLARPENATIAALMAALLAGLIVVGFGTPGPLWPALLWCGAALAPGFVVGFLFAVPRVGEPAAGARLKINNNLVEVSDWLTKIIVGLGLIHLSRVPGYLKSASEYIAPGLQATDQFAAGLLLYFSVLGFLSGYLITRLVWGPVFRAADDATAGEIQQLIAADPESESGRREPLAGPLQATAEQLASVPLAEVPRDADQLTAWARAQFDAERYPASLEGFRRAIELKPDSPRIRYLFALALKYAKVPQMEVVAQLSEAKRLVAAGLEPNMRDRIYISYTFNALFLPPPEGYHLARDAAQEYLATTPQPKPEVLTNLACAYGQQHASAKDETVKREARDNAVDAIKRALAIDPNWRSRFIQLTNGDGGDDDLVTLRDDPEIVAMLR